MAVQTNLFDLTGQVALLTGASKGMGLSMAEGLAEHGADVVVSSRKLDQCESACEQINKQVGRDAAIPFACNIGYKEQLENLVEQTRSKLGRINILVSNAGVNPFYGPMSEIPDSAYDKIMDSNVKSNHWLCQMVAPDMVQSGGGSMMITASVGAFSGSLTLGTYSISKLADIGLVRNLALEYGPSNVRVNAICPGLIKTDFAKALWDNPQAKANAETNTPLRRLGEAEDLKGLVVFLASRASEFITGQAFSVCGGTNMWR